MPELQQGQVIPLSAALATSTDSNGKPLKFEVNKSTGVHEAKGTDGKTYIVTGQPQVANVTVIKDADDKKPKSTDPYVRFLEENKPKAETKPTYSTSTKSK
jgi:hypothetical protein